MPKPPKENKWHVQMVGNRMEVQDAANTGENVPDSVKTYVQNATAYYTEDTQLNFHTDGKTSADDMALILKSKVHLGVVGKDDEEEELHVEHHEAPVEG
jgi:hypothetical protein